MANVLFLAHRLPCPPTKGDKIRSYHFLTHLVAAGHAVHLACFIDDAEDWPHAARLRDLCAECRFAALPRPRAWSRALAGLARGEALSVAVLNDPALAAWVRDLLDRRPVDRVFVFSSAMARFLDALPAAGGGGRRRVVVVDFVDVDSEKWRRLAARRRWPLSWLYRREADRLCAFDREAARRCDRCVFVAAAEARRFRALAPEAADKTVVVPNGVDGAYFSPARRYDDPFEPGGPVVAFVGDMRYWPNEDAALWFAAEVLPRLRAARPGLRFAVVGRAPGRRLRRLAGGGPRGGGVAVTGTVPDVRPYLAHADAVVAPLRVAQGVQNKVLEAMAMAKAVVATPAAVEGLDLEPGRDLLVAATADSFAEAVAGLLLDPRRAAALGARARARVVADYTWAASLGALDRLIAGRPAG